MRGAVPKAIQELAGHTTMTVTMRYMHLAPSTLRDAIGLLNQKTCKPGANKSEAKTASSMNSIT
jgi:hypothetical protein